MALIKAIDVHPRTPLIHIPVEQRYISIASLEKQCPGRNQFGCKVMTRRVGCQKKDFPEHLIRPAL